MGNSAPSSNNSLSQDEKKRFILSIRLSCQWQLARMQALRDGATLAAEQVQDVRLQLLEEGPETDIGQFLVAALVTVALESSVAGLLATTLSSKVLQPLLRTIHWSPEFEKEMLARVLPSSGLSFAKRMNAANVTGFTVRERWLRYEAFVNWLGSSEAQNELVALMKGTFAGTQTLQPDKTPLPSSLSAGTSLLAEIQEWSTTHVLAIQQRHALLEAWLVDFTTNGKELQQVTQSLDSGDITDLSMIRHNWRLICEACIWSSLYSEQLKLARMSQNFDPMYGLRQIAESLKDLTQDRDSSLLAAKTKIDARLIKYWVSTFMPLIEQDIARSQQQSINLTTAGKELVVIYYLQKVHNVLSAEQRQVEKYFAAITPASLAVP